MTGTVLRQIFEPFFTTKGDVGMAWVCGSANISLRSMVVLSKLTQARMEHSKVRPLQCSYLFAYIKVPFLRCPLMCPQSCGGHIFWSECVGMLIQAFRSGSSWMRLVGYAFGDVVKGRASESHFNPIAAFFLGTIDGRIRSPHKSINCIAVLLGTGDTDRQANPFERFTVMLYLDAVDCLA